MILDNLCLDCSKDVIFSIGSNNYFELNLSSHVAEVTSIKEEVDKHKIDTIRLGTWEGNLVYFWEGGSNPKFGVFDRNTKEIRFVKSIEVTGYPAIKSVKHGKGGIYVLDGDNRLHMFEFPVEPGL